ncbi:hypothetical protein JCM11641_006604 [Rhodosporidiobolus odoratus]
MPDTASTTGSTPFDQYLHHATQAAQIAREACLANDPLQQRIQQLESELQVWKLGHQEATSQAKAAQKQLDAGDQIVYCVLDGDGCLFNRVLIQQGRDGGREAAKLLNKKIVEFAETQGVNGQLTVVVNVFVNKYGLSKVFNSTGIADDATFSNFLQGLNAAHPLFQITDVGAQKEAADAKISSSIRLYSKLASCKLVLAGCSHDNGYAHLFSSLETESAAQFAKVYLLKSYLDVAAELKRLNLRTVAFDGLFEPKKLVSWAQVGPPATPRKHSPPRSAENGATPVPGQVGFKTPKTAKKKDRGSDKENGYEGGKVKTFALVPLDQNKPLSKQNPPCCNQHYLAPPCWVGDNCKYSHHYALSAKQLVQLRQDAKKSPCVNALKGKPCEPNCFAGHVCPFKEGCRYGLTCRFNVPGMHPPGTKGRADGWAWKGEAIGGRIAASAASGSASEMGSEFSEEDSGFETTSSVD